MKHHTEDQNNEHQPGQQQAEQFPIASLLYIACLIASGLAVRPGTIVISVIVICFWAVCFVSRRKGVPATFIIINMLAIAAAIAFFCPTIQMVRESHRHVYCSNNMRQLVLSLLNYESGHGAFPESTGMRIGHPVSWRLAICPYIELDQIYRKYDFANAWDAPANLQLANQRFDAFECPSLLQSPKTPYKLVTGVGTIFDGKSLPTFAKVSDGMANTIILIEDHSDFVFWSEPRDIDIEQAIEKLCNLDPANAIHRSEGFFFDSLYGINVGFADGSVGTIGFDVDPELLRCAFQCSDGKPVEIKNRMLGRIVYVTNWGRITATAVYGLLILLPGWFLFKAKKRSDTTFTSNTAQ